MFIADIPPMTDNQVVRYEYIKNDLYKNINKETQKEFLSLIFLKQANRLKDKATDDIESLADSTYERLAIASYLAYLERVGK